MVPITEEDERGGVKHRQAKRRVSERRKGGRLVSGHCAHPKTWSIVESREKRKGKGDVDNLACISTKKTFISVNTTRDFKNKNEEETAWS
jgi:hypothetical protein